MGSRGGWAEKGLVPHQISARTGWKTKTNYSRQNHNTLHT